MKRPFLLTRFNFQILFSAWTLATVPCCSCTSVSLKPQIPPGLLLRRLRLNKPTTSYYNSNPSNGLVINKTHIVAEGGKRLEVTVGGGSGTFTLIDCLLKKNKTNSLRGLWQGKNVCVCVWISADLNVWEKSNVFHAQRCAQAEYCCFCLSPFLSTVIILSPSDPKSCSLDAFWHRILTPAPSHFFITFLSRRCHGKLLDADWG